MSKNTTCQRCSECKDSDHHWMSNGDFGNDPENIDENSHPTGNQYICKHCLAVGDDCPKCEGYGEIEDQHGVGHDCPECRSAGIVETKPCSFESLGID